MNHWKVGTRITAGFGVVVAIAIALGVFAYSKVGNISQSANQVTDQSLPSTYVVGRIEGNLQASLALLLRHAQSSDPQEMADIEAQIQDLRNRIGARLAEYDKLPSDDAQRTLYETFKADREVYWEQFDATLKVSRIGTDAANKQALQMIKQQVVPAHKKADADALALVRFNKNAGEATSKDVKGSVSSAKTGILVCLGTALLVSIVISLFVVRSITRPLAVAAGLVEHVAQGDLSHTVEVTSHDELGQMQEALNRMVGGLKDLANVAVKISEGDLTVEAKTLSDRDILGQALIQMLKSLRTTVTEVASAAANVASGSEEMSSTAEQISQGSTEQAAAADRKTVAVVQIVNSSAGSRLSWLLAGVLGWSRQGETPKIESWLWLGRRVALPGDRAPFGRGPRRGEMLVSVYLSRG